MLIKDKQYSVIYDTVTGEPFTVKQLIQRLIDFQNKSSNNSDIYITKCNLKLSGVDADGIPHSIVAG